MNQMIVSTNNCKLSNLQLVLRSCRLTSNLIIRQIFYLITLNCVMLMLLTSSLLLDHLLILEPILMLCIMTVTIVMRTLTFMTMFKCIECGYIVYKFGDVWCSNSGETFAYFCTGVKKLQKLAYLADYLRMCWTNLGQTFSFDRHMGGDESSDVRFQIAQGTLLQ